MAIISLLGQTAITKTGLGQAWADPTNALTRDSQYASVSPMTDFSTEGLHVTNLDFTVVDPDSTLIDDAGSGVCVVATIRRYNANPGWASNAEARDSNVSFLEAGLPIGANKRLTTVWDNAPKDKFYSWTVSELNALGFFTIADFGTDFGVTVSASQDFKNSSDPDLFVDATTFQMAVEPPAGGGSIYRPIFRPRRR